MKKRKFDIADVIQASGLIIKNPENRKYLLLTHRGFGKRGSIPENSMEAFEASVKLGFIGHELDVRFTRDNEVVIFHGPYLDSTTNGSGLVENQSFAEIRKLNCGNYLKEETTSYQIPTLDAYLQNFGERVFTNIEIKREWYDFRPGLEKAVMDLIKKYNCENRIIISSFNFLSIYSIRRFYPQVLAGILIDKQRMAGLWIPLLIKIIKPDSVHIHRSMATPKWINYIKNKGCGVALWAVETRQDLDDLTLAGVDIMITDNMGLKSSQK